MPGYLEGSEDDDGEHTAEDEPEYYAYGSTPKTRTAMKPVPRTRSAGKIEGKRSMGSKSGRTTPKAQEPSQAVARQSRNMSAARRESKGRRQKARQQARFFKEIDTTLEALGIGTEAEATAGSAAAGAAGGAAGTGTSRLPSPVSSTLSLSLALSSEPHLGALTPTAGSSRAGTPPLGPPGGLGAAAAGAGVGGIGRRVTSEMSLRSSDAPSGCSTPERTPSVAGLLGGGAIARAAGGGSHSSLTGFAVCPHLTGIHSEPAVGALGQPGLRAAAVVIPVLASTSASAPALGQVAAAAAASTAAAAAVATVAERRRATGVAAAALPLPYRRSASYEDAVAAAAANAAGVASAAAAPQHHPTPLRSGWAVAPADRDEFRRQLGSVLVHQGMTGEELESGVAEAEERGEALMAEMSAVLGAAEELGREVDDAEEEAGLGRAHSSSAAPFRWGELTELITSLDDLYRRSKEVLRRVKPCKTFGAENPDLLPRLRDLALKTLAGLAEAAEALGAAACRGLQGLGELGARPRGSLGLGSGYGWGVGGGEDEVRLGGRLVRRIMDALDHITKKIGDELGGQTDAAATELLGRCKAVYRDLAHAGIQAASQAAPVLLNSVSLSADSFAHEKSSQAKRLAALWEEAARQADRVGRRDSHYRLALYGDLCEVYGTAGKMALSMAQGAAGRGPAPAASGVGSAVFHLLDGDRDGDDDGAASATSEVVGCASSVLSYASTGDGSTTTPALALAAPAGVWGGAVTAWGVGGRGGAGVGGVGGGGCGASDRDIQGQAWVPALLQVLLNRASDAHRYLRNELAAADTARERESGPEGGIAPYETDLGLLVPLGPGGGSGSSGGGEGVGALSDARLEELWWLLDEMQQTFAELCVANLRRTVRLCGGGGGEPLPLWALELARDAAEAALRFIHTHEHSSMALGDLLEMEEELAIEMKDWLQTTWKDITGLATHVVNGLLSIRRQINVRRSSLLSDAVASAAVSASASASSWTARAQPSAHRPVAVGTAGGGGGRGRGGATSTGRGASGVAHLHGRPPAGPSSGRRGGATTAAPGGLSYALRGGDGPHQPTQQRQQPGGGISLAQSGRTPSQDPDTMAHWYDKAYDDGAKQRPPLRRPTSPEYPGLAPVLEVTATATTAPDAPAPWLAALLTPATEVRSGRNSMDAAGPRRPTGSESSGGGAPQQSPGGLTTGSQRMAAAAARRRLQPGLAGVSGRGGGGEGGSRWSRGAGCRGHGRGLGRGRQGRGRGEKVAVVFDGTNARSLTEGVFVPQDGPTPVTAAEQQQQQQQQQQQRQQQQAHRRQNAASDGGSVLDDAASDCSSSATALLQPTTPSYASVTRGGAGGGLSAALAAAASGTSARPSAVPTPVPQALSPSPSPAAAAAAAASSPPPASPTALRSPFAIPSSTVHRIAGASPPAPSSPPGAAAPAAASAASASPTLQARFGTVLVERPQHPQQQPASASPSHPRSPFSSQEASPAPSPPPSPLRSGSTNGSPTPPQPLPPAAAATAVPIAAAAGAGGAAAAAASTPVILSVGSPAFVPAIGGGAWLGGVRGGGGVSSGGNGGSGGSGSRANIGSPSFQFAPPRPESAVPVGQAISGAGGGASSTDSTACGHVSSGGGRLTPWLGSPSGSGPMMPAGVDGRNSGTGAAPAPVAGTGAATAGAVVSPFAQHQRNGPNGHAPNGHGPNGHGPHDEAANHHSHHGPGHRTRQPSQTLQQTHDHQHQHQHQHQQHQEQHHQHQGRRTGAGGGVPAPVRAPSLNTQFSVGSNLGRYDSHGMMDLPAGGNCLDPHAAGAFGDPELAALLRTIANDPFWHIQWADLKHTLSNIVGYGSSGQVFCGSYLHGEVAIKVIAVNRETKYDVNALRAFKAEVDLNKRLNNHPNIVRFLGTEDRFRYRAGNALRALLP